MDNSASRTALASSEPRERASTESSSTGPAAEAARPTRKGRARSHPLQWSAADLVGRYALIWAILALVVFFSLLRPDTFFTTDNFKSILITQSVLVVLALGITVPLAAGEFDLSVAALVGFSAGLLAHLTVNVGWPVGLALPASGLAALLVGAVNGLFVVRFGVNSFISTLGVGTILSGLALLIYGPQTIAGLPTALTEPIQADLFGLTTGVYIAVALALLLWYVFENTPAGRYVFFTGEGREAARLAGIRVHRIRFVSFLVSASLAWLAALILLGQTGAAQSNYGNPLLLPAYAAAFLGATSIRPGRYNAWGTVFAVLLLAVGTTGLQLLGAEDWVNDVFNGSALVLAVTLARLVSKDQ